MTISKAKCCCVQGVQLLNSKAIMYGAGGFLDDYSVDDDYKNDLGCIWVASYEASDQRDQSGRLVPGGSAALTSTEPAQPAAEGGIEDQEGQQEQQQEQQSKQQGKQLRLCKLEAMPTKINHIWRSERAASGPAYLSQVRMHNSSHMYML